MKVDAMRRAGDAHVLPDQTQQEPIFAIHIAESYQDAIASLKDFSEACLAHVRHS